MKNLILIISLILIPLSSRAEVSLGEFKKLVEVFHKEFDSELRAKNSLMIINNPTGGDVDFWWKMDQRHASYSGYLDPNGSTTHFLFLFGGYARIPKMTLSGVAMTLCHELGHGIGGAPLKDSGEKIRASVEGQADYFAARFCLKRILKHLPAVSDHAVDPYLKTRCEEKYSGADLLMCTRAMAELENERIFFRTTEGGESETYFDRLDITITDHVELDPYYYPSAQCRLDTMINGILELPRPLCWWKP